MYRPIKFMYQVKTTFDKLDKIESRKTLLVMTTAR